MKHKEMRRHVDNLDTCNDKLKKLIDRVNSVNQTKRKDLTKEQASKQLASSLQQIRHHAIGLHSAVGAAWTVGCRTIHTSLLILDARSAFPNTKADQTLAFHSVLACGESVTTVQDKIQETIITVHQTPCGQPVTDVCQHLAQPKLLGEAFSMEISKDDKLFHCNKQHQAHFGLGDLNESVTLEQLLAAKPRMTPQQKTQLAIDVASSILQLQTTPWFGTTWTNKIIRFFRRISGTVQITDYGKTFIATSFPAQHFPHTDGSVKADLLELGVILLEIWNLEAFESWAARSSIALSTGYYARMTPAIQWLEAESDMMTPAFVDAVSVCVRFSFEGVQHSWEHPSSRRAVCEKVLGPLQENCKAWIRV